MHSLFIIGLGRRGLVHADVLSLRSDVSIVGGYDSSPVTRAQCSERPFPIYADLSQGLERTEPNIILIVTPPRVRTVLIDRFAHLQNIHTLIIEKPLALTLTEAFNITKLCLEKNWNLKVVHQSRYCEEFIALKESINQGRIGKLLFFKAACWGNLFNQGSHTVDLLRWLTNDDKVSWVDATGHDNALLLNQIQPFHSDFEPDMDHPGHLWSSISMRLQSGVEIFMTCGVLDAIPLPLYGPWLQRRIIAVGDAGVAYAHLASYSKDVSLKNPQQKNYITTPNEYLTSLHRYYDHLFSSINLTHNERINEIEDHLFTLATLVAAFASSKRHEIILLPKKVDELVMLDNLIEVKHDVSHAKQTKPVITVIMAMETHRGMGEAAASSWVDQHCDKSLYEIILVFHHHQHWLKKRIEKKIKSSRVKFISVKANNEPELWHHGATLAKGEFLIFTESHCLAEPEAVTEALKFFANEPHAGFYPRTERLCKNTLSEMEAKLYDEGFVQYDQPDYWAKISLHAFGIKNRFMIY